MTLKHLPIQENKNVLLKVVSYIQLLQQIVTQFRMGLLKLRQSLCCQNALSWLHTSDNYTNFLMYLYIYMCGNCIYMYYWYVKLGYKLYIKIIHDAGHNHLQLSLKQYKKRTRINSGLCKQKYSPWSDQWKSNKMFSNIAHEVFKTLFITQR